MNIYTKEEIKALSDKQLDDLLGFYDCPEQVHPIYSQSLDAQFELAKKFQLRYIVAKYPNCADWGFNVATQNLRYSLEEESTTKRTGAELILQAIQELKKTK